jgi:hypothetical protein
MTRVLVRPLARATVPTVIVKHRIPGRLRVAVPEFRFEPRQLRSLADDVRKEEGVVGARVNASCASIAIEYEGAPAVLEPRILDG